MDKRLTSARWAIIPLAQNPESTLSPQPNFMVIDSMHSNRIAELPLIGATRCMLGEYKIVFREILPANEQLGRESEMREIIYEYANQDVPIQIVPALSDPLFLKANLEENDPNVMKVNDMLALFQFRGVLAGHTLSVDADVLDEILQPEPQPE